MADGRGKGGTRCGKRYVVMTCLLVCLLTPGTVCAERSGPGWCGRDGDCGAGLGACWWIGGLEGEEGKHKLRCVGGRCWCW